MVKVLPDTTKEQAFFNERSKVRNPRAVKKEVVITTPNREPKKFKKGNAYQHSKTGARSDLNGLVVRSNWEANFIRVLNLLKIKYEFEPILFQFPPTATGKTMSYLPDIYLPATDEFIEVKGYLDSRGRNKLRKFRKYFPKEFAKLTVVISKNNKANKLFFMKLGVKNVLYYEHISHMYAEKINWEGAK